MYVGVNAGEKGRNVLLNSGEGAQGGSGNQEEVMIFYQAIYIVTHLRKVQLSGTVCSRWGSPLREAPYR